jgi:protein-arginine kinase activator protein McsA
VNNEPTRTWPCEKCGATVERYRGQDDVSCSECGTPYNCFGQRLRDDYRDNPSNYDSDIGDMEGYEMEMLRKEHGE